MGKLDYLNEKKAEKEAKKESVVAKVEIKKESVIDELKKLSLDENPNVSSLSDEALLALVSIIELNDSEGRNIVFPNKDEAVIYASQLQKNVPQIRFCKFIECFSIYAGFFWIIEPMTTELSNTESFKDKLESAQDLTYCNPIILMAIAEIAKRDRAKEELAEKENTKE